MKKHVVDYKVVRNPEHPQFGYQWLVKQRIGSQWIGIGLFRRINDVRDWCKSEGICEVTDKCNAR